MKSSITNVAEGLGLVLTLALFALCALGYIYTTPDDACEIPAAMQGWEAR